MFLCKKCNDRPELDWMFDLKMAISWGQCEMCKKVTECVDIKK